MSFVVIDGGFRLTPLVDAWNQQHQAKPSKAFLKALNKFSRTFAKSQNDWTMDRYFLLATEAAAHSLVSLANPTSTQITNVNSTTFTANQGYTGNASNMYLDTNFNPSTQGVNFTTNSMGYGVYVRTNRAAGSKNEIGLLDASSAITFIARNGANNAAYALNQASGDTYATGTAIGHWQAKRTGASAIELSLDGSQVDTGTNAALTIPNGTIYLLGIHYLAGADFGFSDAQISMAYFSSGVIDHAAHNSAFQTLKSDLGF